MLSSSWLTNCVFVIFANHYNTITDSLDESLLWVNVCIIAIVRLRNKATALYGSVRVDVERASYVLVSRKLGVGLIL